MIPNDVINCSHDNCRMMTAPLAHSAFRNAPPLHLVWFPAIMDIPALLIEILLQKDAHRCVAFLILAVSFLSTQTMC